MKKSLDAIDIMALISELKKDLEKSKLVNIYAINEVFILKFRKLSEKTYLVFQPKIGVYITGYEIKMPKMPPDFILKMRKIIKNSFVEKIEQVNDDRIIRMNVRRGNESYNIYFEIIREGNLIVANSNDEILLALRYKKMRDRTIRVKEKYIPPPCGINPLTVSSKELYEKIKLKKRGKLFTVILKTLNVPLTVLKESFFIAGLNEGITVKEVSLEAFKKIIKVLQKTILDVKNGLLKPNIIFENDKPTGVYPIVYEHLKNSKKLVFYKSFNKAVDDYFTPQLFFKKIEKKAEGIKKRIADIEKTIEEYERKRKILEKKANIIIQNLNIINEILKNVKKVSFEELHKLGGNYNIEVLSIDYSKNKLLIKIDETVISLDIKKSAGENASEYFSEIKKLKKKIVKAKEILDGLERQLEKESIVNEKAVYLKVREKRKWYERFRWFITSDGFLVVGGKNATQNEILVKKYMETHDIFLHADIYGSPVVIIKSKKSKIPLKSILEAAQFTAVYSRAWEAGFSSIDVYWVKPEQVSKKAPSGEYLAKGAFMIYGKRNYIKNVPLAIAFGLKILDKNLEIVYGPPSAVVKKTDVYVLLVPGNLKREKAALQVSKILEEKMLKLFKEKEIGFRIESKKILEMLPKGSFHIVEKAEKVLKELENRYDKEFNEETNNN